MLLDWESIFGSQYGVSLGGDHDSHFEIRLDVSFRICLGLRSCTFRKPLDGQAIVFGNLVVMLFRTQWPCQSFRD